MSVQLQIFSCVSSDLHKRHLNVFWLYLIHEILFKVVGCSACRNFLKQRSRNWRWFDCWHPDITSKLWVTFFRKSCLAKTPQTCSCRLPNAMVRLRISKRREQPEKARPKSLKNAFSLRSFLRSNLLAACCAFSPEKRCVFLRACNACCSNTCKGFSIPPCAAAQR